MAEKHGGRQKGTPNKAKAALLELIEERWPGYHPVLAMSAIAHDETVDAKMRFDAHKEVAQYVTPKLKAVEINAGEGMQTVILDILGRDKG